MATVVLTANAENPYRFSASPSIKQNPMTVYAFSVSRGVVSNFITRPVSDPSGQFWPRGNNSTISSGS